MATPTFSDILPTFELTWSCAQVKLYIWYLSQLVMTASYTPQTLYDSALCITAKHFWSMLPWPCWSLIIAQCLSYVVDLFLYTSADNMCFLVAVFMLHVVYTYTYTYMAGVCNQALT